MNIEMLIEVSLSLMLVLLIIILRKHVLIKFKTLDCIYSITILTTMHPEYKIKEVKPNVYLVRYLVFKRVFINKTYIYEAIRNILREDYPYQVKFYAIDKFINKLNEIIDDLSLTEDSINYIYDRYSNTVKLKYLKDDYFEIRI